MKKLIFFLVLLVPQMAPGQTIDALFAKYKSHESAVYMTIPSDSLMRQDAFQGSKVLLAESLTIWETDVEEFREDLGMLQGYERIDLKEHAAIENELQRKFLDYWIQTGLATYARRRGRSWSEGLSVIPLPNGCWTLMHVKGRLKDRAFQVGFNFSTQMVAAGSDEDGNIASDKSEGLPSE